MKWDDEGIAICAPPPSRPVLIGKIEPHSCRVILSCGGTQGRPQRPTRPIRLGLARGSIRSERL